MNQYPYVIVWLASICLLNACDNGNNREMAASSPQAATASENGEGASVESPPEGADALPEDAQSQTGVAVTYQGIIQATVSNACLSCHSEGGQAAFRPLGTYAEVAGAIDAIIARTSSDENPMPPLSSVAVRDELTKVFIAWRDQGLPENEDGTITSDAVDESGAVLMVAYIDAVKGTIDSACVSCHSEGGQAAQFLLNDYEQVAGNVDASLLRLKDDVNPMPPAADPEIRRQIAELLENWKAQGLPETIAP